MWLEQPICFYSVFWYYVNIPDQKWISQFVAIPYQDANGNAIGNLLRLWILKCLKTSINILWHFQALPEQVVIDLF